ncbi:MAG TPA: hypothetical protein VGI81_00675 [Tepidisphaeraceae bacterium]|jgi:hypothetical protein
MSVVDSTEAAERFVEKWSAADLSERAASQEHFIDLCRLLGQPTPAVGGPEDRRLSSLATTFAKPHCSR